MATILLIEDDDDLRKLTALMLGAQGHVVREAGNGVEGVASYADARADLVITDVVMPEKEGLATILELRQLNPQVKIIAVSGGFAYDSGLYLDMAKKFGADAILRKPFMFEELKAAVDSLLPAA